MHHSASRDVLISAANAEALVDDKAWSELVASTKVVNRRAEPRPSRPPNALKFRSVTMGHVPASYLHRTPLVRGLTGVFATPMPLAVPAGAPIAPASPFAHLAQDYLAARFKSTFEVAISKIFCAGAGWQLLSIVALTTLSCDTNSPAFFLLTGLGDALGVGLGHIAFRCILCSAAINLKAEVLTGLWLGSSAMLSGMAWQYVVNVVSATQPFWPTLLWTSSLCGFAFFCGLRLFRLCYQPLGMESATAGNFGADRLLAASVGAGAGLFTATDPATGIGWLAFLAVQPTDSSALAVFKAGLSTLLGFIALQSAQNVLLPVGANWLDSHAAEVADDEDRSTGGQIAAAALDDNDKSSWSSPSFQRDTAMV